MNFLDIIFMFPKGRNWHVAELLMLGVTTLQNGVSLLAETEQKRAFFLIPYWEVMARLKRKKQAKTA